MQEALIALSGVHKDTEVFGIVYASVFGAGAYSDKIRVGKWLGGTAVHGYGKWDGLGELRIRVETVPVGTTWRTPQTEAQIRSNAREVYKNAPWDPTPGEEAAAWEKALEKELWRQWMFSEADESIQTRVRLFYVGEPTYHREIDLMVHLENVMDELPSHDMWLDSWRAPGGPEWYEPESLNPDTLDDFCVMEIPD